MRPATGLWSMAGLSVLLMAGVGSGSIAPTGPAPWADIAPAPRLCSPADLPAVIDACGDNMEGNLAFTGGSDAEFGSGSFAEFGPGSGAAFTGGADAGFAGAGSDATFTGGADAVFGSGSGAVFASGSTATFQDGAVASFVGASSTAGATFSGGADITLSGSSSIVFTDTGSNALVFPGGRIKGVFKGTVDVLGTMNPGQVGCGFVSPPVPGLSSGQPIVVTPEVPTTGFAYVGARVTTSPSGPNVAVCWINVLAASVAPGPVEVSGLVLL